MHAGPARRTEQKGSRNPSRPLFCALPDAGPSVGMLPVSYKSQTPLHAHQGVQRGLVMRSVFVLRLMPKTISLPFSCLARLSLGLRCRSGCRVPVAHSKAPTEAGAETGVHSLPTGEPHRTSRPVPGLFLCLAARGWGGICSAAAIYFSPRRAPAGCRPASPWRREAPGRGQAARRRRHGADSFQSGR